MFLQFPSDEWFVVVLSVCAVVCQQEGSVMRVNSDGISANMAENCFVCLCRNICARLKKKGGGRYLRG